MKKSLISVAIAGALAVGFTGCVGGQPAKPISLYKPMKEAKILSATNSYVDNGAVVFNNGNKIYDEEGDIKASFTINGKTFYLLSIKGKDLYKVKDSNKKTLKEFNANGMSWFIEGNNVALAVSLSGNQKIGLYDNVYQFDGSNFKLINKNLDLSNGRYTKNGSTLYKRVSKSGMYYIDTWYTKGGYLKNQSITNILTGKKITQIDLEKRTNYDASIYPMVVGVVGDKIYYTYQSGMLLAEYFLEVLDTKTNKVYTLVGDKLFDDSSVKKKMQILKSSDQIVLKIFDNPKLKVESKLFKHKTSVESKYTNESAKFISLNSLKEVSGVSNEFKIVPILSNYNNIGGEKVKETYITFSMTELTPKYIKDIKTKSIQPLF